VRSEPPGFREFVESRSAALLRTAWMLTGDEAAAEDLLQNALARTWPHWARVAEGHPDAYVRKVMLRVNASSRARRWTHEVPTPDALFDPPRQRPRPDDAARVDDRLELGHALMTLPTRQRQVVVLRYFDDLSVETVAELMGCSTGTVKSQSAKGLAKLRHALDPHPTPSPLDRTSTS
jgi:RNA polymerase sigma-70 factor (sigma-E family)